MFCRFWTVLDVLITFALVYYVVRVAVNYFVVKPYTRVFAEKESDLDQLLKRTLALSIQMPRPSYQDLQSVGQSLQTMGVSSNNSLKKYLACVGANFVAHLSRKHHTAYPVTFTPSPIDAISFHMNSSQTVFDKFFSSEPWMGSAEQTLCQIWHTYFTNAIQSYNQALASQLDAAILCGEQANFNLSSAMQGMPKVNFGQETCAVYLLAFLTFTHIIEICIIQASKKANPNAEEDGKPNTTDDVSIQRLQRSLLLLRDTAGKFNQLDVGEFERGEDAIKKRLCLYGAMERTLSGAEPRLTRILFQQAMKT
jgi:hypothetical protein